MSKAGIQHRKLMGYLARKLEPLGFKRRGFFFQKDHGDLTFYVVVFHLGTEKDDTEEVSVFDEILSHDWLKVQNGPCFWDEYGGVPKRNQGYGQASRNIGEIALGKDSFELQEETHDQVAGIIWNAIETTSLPFFLQFRETNDLVAALNQDFKIADGAAERKVKEWVSNWTSFECGRDS